MRIQLSIIACVVAYSLCLGSNADDRLFFGEDDLLGYLKNSLASDATLEVLTDSLGEISLFTDLDLLAKAHDHIRSDPSRFPSGVADSDKFYSYRLVGRRILFLFQIRNDMWVNSFINGAPALSLSVPWDTLDEDECLAVMNSQPFWRVGIRTNGTALVLGDIQGAASLSPDLIAEMEVLLNKLQEAETEDSYGASVVSGSHAGFSIRLDRYSHKTTTVYRPNLFLHDTLPSHDERQLLKLLLDLAARIREGIE